MRETPTGQLDFTARIPVSLWAYYRPAIEVAEKRGLRFAIGGGLAYSAYARRWRNTKDLDLFILPAQRQAMVEVVRELGFEDYHATLPYDRGWIFRGHQGDVIIDLIWQMANYRTEVDEIWLTGGRQVEVHGSLLRLLPVEELIWSKLYVLQRDRSDWPDLLSILNVEGPGLDWRRLLDRLGHDAPLLGGVMNVFGWLCPDRARQCPRWIWETMGLREPVPGPGCATDRTRVRLLDGRDWFGPQ